MVNQPIATTPDPPYYAVVFTSRHSGDDFEGYAAMAARMMELAAEQPGFLGVETARRDDGVGITVSYWADEASIRAWHDVAEHRAAQERGKQQWYPQWRVRVCKVEREYGTPFDK